MNNSQKYNDEDVSAALAKCRYTSRFAYAEALSELYEASDENSEARRMYGLLHSMCMSPIRNASMVSTSPFLENDVKKLISIKSNISNTRLRALVLDSIWTYGRKIARENAYRYAVEAIECYLSVELTDIGWIRDGQEECMERALRIALSIGKAGTAQYEAVKKKLRDAYKGAIEANGDSQFLFGIPQLLLDVGTKDVITPREIIANFLKHAEAKKTAGKEFDVQMSLQAAIEWCEFGGEKDSLAMAHRQLAESYWREADSETQKVEVSWLRAAHFYGMSHAEYLKIDKSCRGDDSSEVLLELERKSDEACRRAMPQMHSTQLLPIDVSEDVKKVEDFIKGADAEIAIRRFCSLLPIKETDVEAFADGLLKGGVLSSIFSKTVIGPGAQPRVVGQVPGISQDRSSEEYKKRYWCEKVGGLSVVVGMYFQSRLYPAYCILKREHDLSLGFFTTLVKRSSLIPTNHKRTYAEALSVGYSGQFTLATYVLVPEIENIIRTVLNAADISTTSVHDGMLQENGLSQLVKEEKLVELFSSDFVFILKGIFTDHLGPNVRNEVAHGLKDDTTFNSYIDFYVWWFALSLVFYTAKEEGLSDEV